jgi:hypothetical protein
LATDSFVHCCRVWLQQKLPKISAAFIHYSSALVTNFIAETNAQAMEPSAAPTHGVDGAAEVSKFLLPNSAKAFSIT